jgi:predicted RNA-binding Zn ribbon-like protein
MAMNSKKLSSRANAYLGIVTLVVILAVVGLTSEMFFHRRLDLTQGKQFTLSKASLNTIRSLPDLVTVKVVMSKDLPTQFLQIRTHVVDLLREFEARPQLVRHDEWDYHLHATTPDAPLVARMAVEAAMAMVDVVRTDELSRLRTCDMFDCDDVLVDLSRNRSKRYCDLSCSNRAAVAAYRSRQADQG